MNLSALGVTPAKEKQFNKKGIFTAEDLISFLPRKYQDFTPPQNRKCHVYMLR